MWLTSQTRFFNFLFWRFSLFLCRLFSTHAREDVEVRHMWKLHGGVGAQHRFHLMVYKKGYRTESDCAIETAQWRNNKGLGRKLRERDEFVKMKVGSRLFFRCVERDHFFSVQIQNRIGWQSNQVLRFNICLPFLLVLPRNRKCFWIAWTAWDFFRWVASSRVVSIKLTGNCTQSSWLRSGWAPRKEKVSNFALQKCPHEVFFRSLVHQNNVRTFYGKGRKNHNKWKASCSHDE